MSANKLNKSEFFKRQTTLKEIGEDGQNKLQNAKIAIIGCGGLGSIAAVYLAASGIGKIKLIDFDTVNLSNLHRQTYFTLNDVDKPKAEILAKHIKKITPFTDVITDLNAITKQNIKTVLNDYTLILDCTDNLPIKYLINDYCVLNNKTLIYGSLFKFDGYVATFNFSLSGKRTANLRDAFPKIPTQNIPNCSETGTLNTIVGIIGLQQANEVLKIITSIGKPLTNQILIYNTLDNSQFKMKLKPKFTKTEIEKIYKNETYQVDFCINQLEEFTISKKDFLQKIKQSNVNIISVIEDQHTILPFKKVTKIPLSKLKENPIELDKNKEYILICNKGISSYEATLFLKNKHPNITILSLKNGISNF